MNVTKFLTARVTEENAIVLETTDAQATLKVLGSSLKTSWPRVPGHHNSRSLVIYPQPGEHGIIALSLWVHLGRYHKNERCFDHLPVFLEITEKDGKPWINLDQTWLPTERIGMIFDYKITAQIKDQTFVKDEIWSARDKQPNVHLVQDGDLLCRYLYGTAMAHEVLHAVVQERLEPTRASVINSLTNQVRRLAAVAQDAAWLRHDRDETAAFCAELFESYSAIRMVALDAKWLSDLIKKGRWALFFLSEEAKEKMATFVEAFDAISGKKLENKLAH